MVDFAGGLGMIGIVVASQKSTASLGDHRVSDIHLAGRLGGAAEGEERDKTAKGWWIVGLK